MQDNLQRMVSINYILQSEILYNRKVKSLKFIFILGIKECSSGQILFMFFIGYQPVCMFLAQNWCL